MDETRLRQLEKHFKLRVRTGCDTCRIRRVKCDETKPECARCTKTGRKCEGYQQATKPKDGSAAAAASYRNSSFLVVPRKPRRCSISRNPSRSLSPDPMENRSFHYFQTQTIPKWTEFFESELWSQTVLQLSHTEPAIKHGILALSGLHERFEGTSPTFSTTRDFAFVQYMHAVKHSNHLLSAHPEGRADLEKVLIACIIFTCYENLAGNYKAANMHLHNGLRILNQYKGRSRLQVTASQESVANVLYRFDLQAMTFSDDASPYGYTFDSPPECPQIPKAYTSNSAARNDLVGLLRCLLWTTGVVMMDPQASEHPTLLQISAQLTTSFDKWEKNFASYQQNMHPHELGNPKIYAGNTLLKMYSIMCRVFVGTGARRTEMAWDAFVDSFKTLVDLAETLPTFRPRPPPSSPSPLSPRPGHAHMQPAKNRPIAPNPRTASSPSPPGPATMVFRCDSASPVAPSPRAQRSMDAPSPSQRAPSSFSPSFELSPIAPLFLTAFRCRDPIVRRRAIALLLNCRRREGVWDSLGAGLVAAECVKKEERLHHVDLPPDNWLPLTPSCRRSEDIPESRRIQGVHIAVDLAEGRINLAYRKMDGSQWREQRGLGEEGFVIGGASVSPSVGAEVFC